MARRPPNPGNIYGARQNLSQPKTPPTIVDGAIAPEIVVDGFTGVQVTNGLVRLNLFVDRFDMVDQRAKRVVVQRFAMTPDVLATLARGFTEVIEDLVGRGAITPPLGYENRVTDTEDE